SRTLCRAVAIQGTRHHTSERTPAQALATRSADDFPGPNVVAEPASYDRTHRGHPDATLRGRQRTQSCARNAGTSRFTCRLRATLSTRAVRRTTSARGHRARYRLESVVYPGG